MYVAADRSNSARHRGHNEKARATGLMSPSRRSRISSRPRTAVVARPICTVTEHHRRSSLGGSRPDCCSERCIYSDRARVQTDVQPAHHEQDGHAHRTAVHSQSQLSRRRRGVSVAMDVAAQAHTHRQGGSRYKSRGTEALTMAARDSRWPLSTRPGLWPLPTRPGL